MQHHRTTPTAAIYVRTTVTSQQPAHLQQEATAIAYAACLGRIVVGTYVDAGVSGNLPLGDRPAGARLLADARASQFTSVIVTALDRLGRNVATVQHDIAELDSLGVCLDVVEAAR